MEIGVLLNSLIAVAGVIGLLVIVRKDRQARQRDHEKMMFDPQPMIVPPMSKWMRLPRVSFLVAAWNEEAHVVHHIRQFCMLRYPNKELIICAGGADNTYALAAQMASPNEVLVFEQQAGEGKQKSLQRIFPESDGEIIYLTDADCELTDEAVEQLIYPIAIGLESVCSGAIKPSADDLKRPFIFSQAASMLYSALSTPDYTEGLLGGNCAMARSILEASDSLAAPAPTGTDYVLAKEILKTGAKIKHQPQSQLVTHYPSSAKAYIRRQRRWIRNVMIHGHRYDAQAEMKASLRTSLIGLMMLLLPLTFFVLGSSTVVIWSLLFLYGLLSRFRYLRVASHHWQRPLRPADYAWQGPLMLLDFVAWVQPLLDYWQPKRRVEW